MEKTEKIEKIKTELQEGEKILWTGEVGKTEFFSNEMKKNILIKWSLCLCVYIGITVLMAFSQSKVSFKGQLILIAIVGLMAFLPYREWKTLYKCKFYITDKRIITVKDNTDVYAMDKGCAVKKIDNEDGSFTFVFGTVKNKPSELLSRTIIPVSSEDHKSYDGAVFYHIKDDISSLV